MTHVDPTTMPKFARITKEGPSKGLVCPVTHEGDTHYLLYLQSERTSFSKQDAEPVLYDHPWIIRVWFHDKPDTARSFTTEEDADWELRNIPKNLPWDFVEMLLTEPAWGRVRDGHGVNEKGVPFFILNRWVRTNGGYVLKVNAPRLGEPCPDFR